MRVNRRIFVTCLVILQTSCAVTTPVTPFEDQTQVWPEPPNSQRITFVGDFRRSADFGIKVSAWGRLLRLAAGSNDDRMVRPMDVVTTADRSVVFVADPDAQCVHRYDLVKVRYSCLTLGKNQPPVFPIGLAITNDDLLLVSDSQQRQLFQLEPGGKRLKSFYTGTQLDQPTGLFWDPASQQLYVTDTGMQSILVFDIRGNLKRSIGKRGGGFGEVNFPTYLWVDNASNDLLVTDSLNFRVQRFDADGNFLLTFGKDGDKPGDFSRPKGVATDSYGHIYVIDALMHSMQIFSSDGELLLALGGQGQDQGQFWLPNGIFITGDDMIFVADSYNKRIQVFRYVGPES